MPTAPKKLRKQYLNAEYPNVVLRFEDGHEIVLKRGVGKTFDCYAGETIKLLAVRDPDAREASQYTQPAAVAWSATQSTRFVASTCPVSADPTAVSR